MPHPPTKKRRLSSIHDAIEEKLVVTQLSMEGLADVQIHKICKNTMPSSKHLKAIDALLHQVKNIVDDVPEIPPMPVIEAVDRLRRRGIVLPIVFPELNKHAKYKVAYAKPAHCNVIGCRPLDTIVVEEDEVTVELAICMPRTLFDDKDYLNYRYFYKRAYYLAVLANALSDATNMDSDLSFHFANDDELRPELLVRKLITEEGHKALTYVVRITPVLVEPDAFPVMKLGPSQCCIKKNFVTGALLEITKPTPEYNSALLADSTAISYLKFLNLCKSKCAGFREACILGTCWLNNRGFNSTISGGGFGAFEWSLLMGILLHTGGRKDQGLSSLRSSNLQLFQTMMHFIAKGNLMQDPLVFGSSLGVQDRFGSPMILDALNNFNILHNMTSASYQALVRDAQITCDDEKKPTSQRLEALFLNKLNTDWRGYDLCVRLRYPATSKLSSDLNYVNKACKVLSEGLGDRLKNLRPIVSASSAWALDQTYEQRPRTDDSNYFFVGLRLHDVNSRRMVDHGPAIEDVDKCNAFRSFWGKKAELRRFADGQVTETIVWDKSLPVIPQIVEYVVRHHLDLASDQDVVVIGNELDKLVPGMPNVGPTTLGFNKVRLAFDKLVKTLRDLEGLPLHIKDIAPADSQLRFTSIQPVTAGYHTADQLVEVTLGFEASAKWPDDLHLVQKSKVALLLKLGELLQDTDFVSQAQVGLDISPNQISNLGFLDVHTTDEIAFRIRIFCDQEITLARQGSVDKSRPAYIRRHFLEFSSAFELEYLQSPLHNQAMVRLCQKLTCLSPTVRLVKKWFARHLLMPHVSEALIEIITTQSFLVVEAEVPSTIFSAFLRTLSYLTQWRWWAEPLIVDLTGELSNAQYLKIYSMSATMRQANATAHKHPLHVFAIYDDSHQEYLVKTPSKVVAARLTGLAKVACAQLSSIDQLSRSLEEMFTPSLGDYNIIMLVDFTDPSTSSGRLKRYKNIAEVRDKDRDNDIAIFRNFINDVKTTFGDQMLLFYDELEHDLVCAVWRPDLSHRIRTSYHPYSTWPKVVDSSRDAQTELVANKEAITSELLRLGEGFVRDISWR